MAYQQHFANPLVAAFAFNRSIPLNLLFNLAQAHALSLQ